MIGRLYPCYLSLPLKPISKFPQIYSFNINSRSKQTIIRPNPHALEKGPAGGITCQVIDFPLLLGPYRPSLSSETSKAKSSTEPTTKQENKSMQVQNHSRPVNMYSSRGTPFVFLSLSLFVSPTRILPSSQSFFLLLILLSYPGEIGCGRTSNFNSDSPQSYDTHRRYLILASDVAILFSPSHQHVPARTHS